MISHKFHDHYHLFFSIRNHIYVSSFKALLITDAGQFIAFKSLTKQFICLSNSWFSVCILLYASNKKSTFSSKSFCNLYCFKITSLYFKILLFTSTLRKSSICIEISYANFFVFSLYSVNLLLISLCIISSNSVTRCCKLEIQMVSFFFPSSSFFFCLIDSWLSF
ncbi:hypothetical protein SAIN_1182 [Streptococcus anginosus C1051]|nr:hypothetical protein SAIN_1182 [Streptococcus anginosus C1051]